MNKNLPFADKSFDTLVEALVFYSLENLNTTISDVLRVLKPSDIFIFIDHVLPEKKSLIHVTLPR